MTDLLVRDDRNINILRYHLHTGVTVHGRRRRNINDRRRDPGKSATEPGQRPFVNDYAEIDLMFVQSRRGYVESLGVGCGAVDHDAIDRSNGPCLDHEVRIQAEFDVKTNYLPDRIPELAMASPADSGTISLVQEPVDRGSDVRVARTDAMFQQFIIVIDVVSFVKIYEKSFWLFDRGEKVAVGVAENSGDAQYHGFRAAGRGASQRYHVASRKLVDDIRGMKGLRAPSVL